MNTLKKLLIIFGLFTLFNSCTEKEDLPLADCYTCEETEIEYCYTIGNSYYTSSATNYYSKTELKGDSWSKTKDFLTAQCNGTLPVEDCYVCTSTNTAYCYTTDNTYYTVSINESIPTEIPLNDVSWEDLRTAFEDNCTQSNSIVGNWDMTGYTATVITEKTPVGTTDTTVLTSYHVGENYSYAMSITENPNELQYGGSYTFNITGDSEDSAGGVTAGSTVYEWSLDGSNLEITRDDYDEYVTTILELTETTLKLKIETLKNTELDGVNYKTNTEVFETYEK